MTRLRTSVLAAIAGISIAGGYAATSQGTDERTPPVASTSASLDPARSGAGAAHIPVGAATSPAAVDTTPATSVVSPASRAARAPTGRPAPAPTSPGPSVLPQDPSPPIGPRLSLGNAGYGEARPALPGTVGLAVSAPDPAGGAPWAVRTFQRAGQHGHRVWCAQLGRLVDDQFVWITPGAARVGPMRASENEVTSCAISAPIAQRLGVAVASMPDRSPADPGAQIETTLVWGVVDRAVKSARVDRNGTTTTVSLRRHAFLQVLPGTEPATRARLTVVDAGGGVRTAIPPAFFDLSYPAKPSPGESRYAEPSTLHQIATVQSGTRDLPSGVFVRRAGGQLGQCFTGPIAAIAGRAVVGDQWSGLVRQPQVECSPLPPEADRGPVAFGGSGWTSGDPSRKGTPQAAAAYRRRVWRRVPAGGGGLGIAVPKGATLLEVRSPVGVKTVRVGPDRVTYVGFEGQPEVRDAMFPQFQTSKDPRHPRIVWLEPPLTFRALDAQGRQIGATGSTRR